MPPLAIFILEEAIKEEPAILAIVQSFFKDNPDPTPEAWAKLRSDVKNASYVDPTIPALPETPALPVANVETVADVPTPHTPEAAPVTVLEAAEPFFGGSVSDHLASQNA